MSMEPRVLMRDKRTGKLVLFHVLPDGRFVVESRMDVEPILEANKDIRAVQPEGWKADTHHVAKLDMRVWQQLRSEGRLDDPKDFAKWLNDPDHRQWRSKLGRV